MKELESLVIQAQKGNVEAYGNLVKRFQDMAYGYSFSLLGDFHLAQDAAQEAFVEAYRKLSQLRNPAAFAGWFRRVVFKHCDRFTRGRRHTTVPIEKASGVSSKQPGPAEIAERNQMKEEIVRAVRALPKQERTATSLYYIDGYSQKEIADFLEVPVETVKSRLHRSRKRLKERMIMMVDKTMKGSPLGEDFTDTVVRKVTSVEDLEGARRHLSASYHGKREPEGFQSVQAAQDANIYIVAEGGRVESAGYYGEMDWGIGRTILKAVRPREMAGESKGVPDSVFIKGFRGCFSMARERGCALAVVHGSMYDHGFCGFVPSFYYCLGTLPVDRALNASATIERREAVDKMERRKGHEALLTDPYAAKISAFLGGGCMYVLVKGKDVLGYYNINPDVFEKARKAKMSKPFGYVNRITVKNRQAAVAVLHHAAEIAAEAGEKEIRILESHDTTIIKTLLSLGGTYLMRSSCGLAGLDAEMAAIIDLEDLTLQLRDEFQCRLAKIGSNAKLSLEMADTTVGFVWEAGGRESGRLEVVAKKLKVHRVLPRWVMTRLYMGYHSGADILGMGPIPWDRSDGKNPDAPRLDMRSLSLPENEAALFKALFPKLWPCSLPDPDVWPWVVGALHPRYQYEDGKSLEMKAQIDALRFPWIGY
jgi:RNA polymerase sigma factor (sigma-70 family)